MRLLKAGFFLVVVALIGACTPEFTQQKGKELATQARLLDAVDIQRTNQRLLSRQAQICLVGDADTATDNSNLLRIIQAGFNGYFVAVGVENQPLDYLRAVATSPCPGSTYLFYVQPIGAPICINGDKPCDRSNFQYVITVAINTDHSIVDRINISIKNSFIGEGDSAARLQKAFSRIAIDITGAESR
ncbi:MAG: hypothetical protein JWM78_2367 [Verrucomicrobiaceae bacterium]|nr:hypothetical protein [Verrucomicrobiaceae bacterium]